MTPAEKEELLKSLGFFRLSLDKAQIAVTRLQANKRSAGKASAYCLYSKSTGSGSLMAKKPAVRFREAFDDGKLGFLQATPGERASTEPVATAEPTQEASATGPAELDYEWPEFTAIDLFKLFDSDVIPNILLGLELAQKEGNTTLPRFLQGLLEGRERWPDMPGVWLCAVVGFPLIAEVINAPGFASLAHLIEIVHPYLGSNLRREYHQRVRTILRELWVEVSLWALPSGHQLVPRGEIKNSPVFNTLEYLKAYDPPEEEIQRQNRVLENALVKGHTTLYHSQGELVRVEDTLEGHILDVISRLPDVDRQKGKIFGRKVSLTQVLLRWCTVNPEEYQRDRQQYFQLRGEST